jgi:hypothetical protein
MSKAKSKLERLAKKKRDRDARLVADIERQLEDGADVPAQVNNFHVNQPKMAVPNNCWLDKICQPRNVQGITPAVNGKVADEGLIHKPVAQDENQKFFPTIDPNVVKKSKGLKNKGA